MRISTNRYTMNNLSGKAGWAAAVTAAATAAMVGVPLEASASPAGAALRPRTVAAASPGAVYGGVTPQDFPVVIQMSKDRRHVVRAAIALEMPCTSGGFIVLPDIYRDLSVSKAGKFRISFGPVTQRNDDGTTSDYSGKTVGALNAARTKVSGSWQFKVVDHDPAGGVTDTCDSGTVSWTAKQ